MGGENSGLFTPPALGERELVAERASNMARQAKIHERFSC
jgi:hypothetical protein